MNTRKTNPEFTTLFGCQQGTNGRIVVVGAPYDRGTSVSKTGAADGPSTLRDHSGPQHINLKKHGLYDLARRTYLVGKDSLSDIGNVRFQSNKQTDAQYLDYFQSVISRLVAEDRKPLVIGGDHLITLSVLCGYANAGRHVQVVHLDAHHDYDSIDEGEIASHATFMSYVANEGLAKQVLQIGVRGLSWGAPVAPTAIDLIDIRDLSSRLLPDTDVYITIDTDAFDPSIAPGVSYPVPNGLTARDLMDVLNQIRGANVRIAGCDWVEFNPRFDSANHVTARFIVQGLAHVVSAMDMPTA